ncbi:unnamed protein product [Lathyrus sativus]|nr:unnamed protein product [Lathyrus sativus]
MLRMKALDESAWKDMKEVLAQYWSRDKPIITLLEGIKHYLTKRITNQKELMIKYIGNVCPRVQLALEKSKKFAESWSPTWHGDDNMAIFGVINDIKTYCVNIKEGTCACRKWDLTGNPCSHAITCIWHNKKHPEEFVSEYHRKTTFQNTYSHIIYPTNGPQLCPVDVTLIVSTPMMRGEIGCPKKLRNKRNDEPKNPHVLPRKITTVTCTKYGSMRHNKRTCKGKRAIDMVMTKGGNKKQKITKGKSKGNGKKTHNASQPTQEVGSCSQGPSATQD